MQLASRSGLSAHNKYLNLLCFVMALTAVALPQGEWAHLRRRQSSLRRNTSPHRRDNELGAFLDAGRPARGHRLGLGVEAHRVRAVLVKIAEARALPPAEGVVGERHGDREIHSDHA